MAIILKQQYELVSLKISLQGSGLQVRAAARGEAQSSSAAEPATVTFDLEISSGGSKTTLQKSWTYPVTEIGLPARFPGRSKDWYDYRVPNQLLIDLNSQILFNSSTTLWLHLQKPYGLLGMVPWEELLQPTLQRPILRLPDFVVPKPLETLSTLDILICCSAPIAKFNFDVVQNVQHIVNTLRMPAMRRVRLQVFAGLDAYPQLQKVLPPDVLVHYPGEAAQYEVPGPNTQISDVAGRINNPWLLWIRDALRGKSVDAVHFICHGYLAAERGAVAFAESPVQNEDTRIARFAGTSEIIAFLSQVGAWGAVFSSPSSNFSASGLRLLADTIAQLRPFSVIHHDMRLDPSGTSLGEAYRLVFGTSPGQPPLSKATFIYCQPYRVADIERFMPSAAEEAPSRVSLESRVQAADNLPAWLASSQRYLDQCKWRLQQLSDPTLAPSPDLEQEKAGIADAIQQIEAALNSLAQKEAF